MMRFEFYNPTKLIFGVGEVERVGEFVKSYGNKALIVLGRESAKKSGVLDRVVKSLEDKNIKYAVFTGIEPNPRLSTVVKASQFLVQEKCDFVVALGGGSVMDAAKVIAAIPFYEYEIKDMFKLSNRKQRIPKKAYPIITIPTLAATGSEMNKGAVITIDEGEERLKTFVQSDVLYPKVAIVDPQLTISVPKDHTAYGVSDILAHLTEGYFNGIEGTPIQDRFAEGVIKTVIEWGPKAVNDGKDLEARAQVQWASIVALNGWVQVGTYSMFPVHLMEHTLSAIYDIPHGAGLSIINPAWMKFAVNFRMKKFVNFAQNIFNVKKEGDELDIAKKGIEMFENFLASIGCPTRLSQINIKNVEDRMIEKWVDDTLRVLCDEEGKIPGIIPLKREDIFLIYKMAL